MSSVLIVDDEPLVRVSISQMIDRERSGIDHVYTAANGAEALDTVMQESDIVLVLLDLVMPTMDGIEFLRQLALRHRTPRVVVLSSHDDYAGVREAFRLGVDDYLLKTDLDKEMIAALLEQTRPAERPSVQRHNLRSLQRGFLRETILGSVSGDTGQRARELSMEHMKAPYILIALWVHDMSLVRLRYDAEGLAAFEAMLPEYVSEIVERGDLGFVCPMDIGHVVVVLHSGRHDLSEPGRLKRLERQTSETLLHYLNVEIDQNRSAPVTSLDTLSSVYVRIAGSRPVLSRTVARAQSHVHQNYDDPDLTLETVSEVVGVSRTHLSSQFRKEVGTAFSAYLTRVRVEAAKQLLACTDLKVYQVAERVGYATPEHFSRVFKRETGVPPGGFAAATAG